MSFSGEDFSIPILGGGKFMGVDGKVFSLGGDGSKHLDQQGVEIPAIYVGA